MKAYQLVYRSGIIFLVFVLLSPLLECRDDKKSQLQAKIGEIASMAQAYKKRNYSGAAPARFLQKSHAQKKTIEDSIMQLPRYLKEYSDYQHRADSLQKETSVIWEGHIAEIIPQVLKKTLTKPQNQRAAQKIRSIKDSALQEYKPKLKHFIALNQTVAEIKNKNWAQSHFNTPDTLKARIDELKNLDTFHQSQKETLNKLTDSFMVAVLSERAEVISRIKSAEYLSDINKEKAKQILDTKGIRFDYHKEKLIETRNNL